MYSSQNRSASLEPILSLQPVSRIQKLYFDTCVEAGVKYCQKLWWQLPGSVQSEYVVGRSEQQNNAHCPDFSFADCVNLTADV